MRAPSTGQRGPVEHERREQIMAAADQHFRHYGYKKTTVADVAKAIKLSTAYIYKFFDSKQSIAEAICAGALAKISGSVQAIADEDRPAVDRLRRVFRALAKSGADLFFHERKMHDMVAANIEEKWQSGRDHQANLLGIIERIIQDGRKSGEFERKTPLHETCRAVMLATQPIQHPVLLEQILDTLDDDATLMANLVLRSLTA